MSKKAWHCGLFSTQSKFSSPGLMNAQETLTFIIKLVHQRLVDTEQQHRSCVLC